MIVGVPKEIKQDEYRVGLTPVGVEALVSAGHRVIVQAGAGSGSGIDDDGYREHGARIVRKPEGVYSNADLVVKVKEPQPQEYKMLRPGQVLFTYFHFAASRALTEAMIKSGIVAIAYETIRTDDGQHPLLTPMSEVAGRMAIQEGAKCLERPMDGRGILLSGVPGVEPANVAILGGGVVGTNAAKIAVGLGARVTILDVNLDRLRYLDDIMPNSVVTLMSNPHNIREQIRHADLLIGAVLIEGARAPRLISRSMLKTMKPRSVIIDVAIDQGGCIATSKPTTHSKPTFIVDDVVHYCVTNMPGAVGRTSTYALTNVTLPYIVELAKHGYEAAARKRPDIARGLNIVEGKVTNKAVARTFHMKCDAFE